MTGRKSPPKTWFFPWNGWRPWEGRWVPISRWSNRGRQKRLTSIPSVGLDSPDPAFLARLTIFRILNKNLVMKNKNPGRFGEFGDYGEKFLTTQDAGSGPYKVISMKHGDRLVLEKFQDYSLAKWGPNSIDRMTLFIIPEHVTIAAKFEKGELDMGVWSLPVKTIQGWKKNPNFDIRKTSPR